MKFDAFQYLLLAGVEEQIASDWLALRKSKKAPPTQTAINAIVKQSNLAGMTLNETLEACCMNGWQGFKAEWVTPKKSFIDKKASTLNQLTGRTADVIDFNQMRLINAA
jgi:hypothetical protein